MILTTWLKINLLIAPTHRPVNLPDKFSPNTFIEAKSVTMSTRFTNVRDRSRCIIVTGDTCQIFPAILTIRLEGIIGIASLVNSLLLGLQRLMLSQNSKDLGTLAHGLFDLLHIIAPAIGHRLANIARMNTQAV